MRTSSLARLRHAVVARLRHDPTAAGDAACSNGMTPQPPPREPPPVRSQPCRRRAQRMSRTSTVHVLAIRSINRMPLRTFPVQLMGTGLERRRSSRPRTPKLAPAPGMGGMRRSVRGGKWGGDKIGPIAQPPSVFATSVTRSLWPRQRLFGQILASFGFRFFL